MAQISRQSERRSDNEITLDQLLESLPVAVITFKRGILLSANESFHEYIGPEVSKHLKPGLTLNDYIHLTHALNEGTITEFDILDNDLVSLLHKTDIDAWVAERMKIYTTNNTYDEYDDEIGWWRGIQKYYPEDDTYVGIRININELKNAQKKAIVASEAKSNFLANMSHEIRTPMNGVIGMAQVLQNSQLTDAQAECVSVIMRSGEALLTIINDILDFSKIEAGKLEIEAEPFNLEDAAEDVVALLGGAANQKGVELILDHQNAAGCFAIGDIGRIRQILTNLVGNAIKFTASGFVLIKMRIANSSDGLTVDINVKDTGIGISQEALGRIFDEFSQADNSTTRIYGGTGLGLSITTSLVEAMNGTIRAESTIGEGTTVFVQLNLQQGDDLKGAADRALGKQISTLHADSRVLIVDDLPQNLAVLEGLLNNMGISPDKANSVKEAAAKIKQIRLEKSNYDLLITDYQMPEVDGYSFVKAIRKNPAFKDLEIVVLSSVSSDDLKAKFSQFEKCLYHQKPVRMAYLQDSIEKTLASSKPDNPVHVMAPQETVMPQTNRKRILIAEDDKTNQLVMKRMLEPMGYELDIVDNGEIAYQLFQTRPYDLILMDISMPVMDGPTALALIRAAENGQKRTPVIAVTAHALKGEKESFLNIGFDSYLSKPITESLLRGCVANWLEDEDISLQA